MTGAISIRGLDHVGVRTRDRGAMERFYVGLLGLAPHPAKPNWLCTAGGDPVVHLMPATDASQPGNDIADLARHVAVAVDDLEGTVVHLLCHGLRPFQVTLESHERRELTDAHDLSFGLGTVFVADPEGNMVEFVDRSRGIFWEVLGAPVP